MKERKKIMKNFKTKLLSGLLASAMVFGMGAAQLKANAAFTYPNDASTIDGDKTTTFKKFLIVDDGDNVPNVTFQFTIAPADDDQVYNLTTTPKTMQILKGVGTPTISSSGEVTFADEDTSSLTADTTGHTDVTRQASDRETGLTEETGVELEAGEKFAVKELTVDFTSVVFPEPGIYRYVITEAANDAHEAAGIMHDNDVDRVLDVYVVHVDGTPAVAPTEWYYGGTTYTNEDEAKADVDAAGGSYDEITNNGTAAVAPHLKIASYVLHKNANDSTIAMGDDFGSNPNVKWVYNGTEYDSKADAEAAGGDDTTIVPKLTDKTDGFTNEYNSKDLAFKKEVTGNQASRDKYFEFTVELKDVNDDDVFTVSLVDDSNDATNDGNADSTSGTNAATIADNQGKSNPTTLTGEELKAGAKFYLQHGQHIVIRGIAPNATYTVTENAEDYKSTASAVTDYTDPTKGTIGTIAGDNKMVKTSYLNTRDGLIPTGILTVVGPAVVLILLAVAGLSIVMIGKRRKEESAN